ncbi:hypothetical protein MES4922_300119 [Mesorhizobium ventifaucium]|uniref:Uncharacterized protein n=1 Tax=Mesorhizobium ventifaucium TaxID=666020 RepID=A0ABN8K0S8_9HYPH|nr:hypothetical protein MES4922_300119 [Mesorhizobium ventifaucium]
MPISCSPWNRALLDRVLTVNGTRSKRAEVSSERRTRSPKSLRRTSLGRKSLGRKSLGLCVFILVQSLSWAGPGRLARRLREMPIHFLTLILMFISQCNTGLAESRFKKPDTSKKPASVKPASIEPGHLELGHGVGELGSAGCGE